MGHWKPKRILLIFFFSTCLCNSNGCSVVRDPDVNPWGIPHAWIYDTFNGTFWQNQTTGIVVIDPSETNGRGYYSIDIVDSVFVLSTTALFERYEEYEVAEIMLITTRFRCSDGSDSPTFSVWVNVRDTNNNPPTFLLPPENEFVFTIAAPVPPGFEITGCLYDMIVRDIDLTTEKIIFEIEENPYFEVEEEVFATSATPKEFKAIIRTKTFIRSIPEPIKLTVSATDHDRTNDDPITTTTTITIVGNSDFELPEEPVFSEAIYFANYTDDNRVILNEPISLRSGYNELVKFDIKGDFSDNFALESIPDHKNRRTIRVLTPLEDDVLSEKMIHLIVTADREHTSGASAIVVLRLPEARELRFGASIYRGSWQDNLLTLDPIPLTVGYDSSVVFSITGDYKDYFSVTSGQNPAVINQTATIPSVLLENNIIILTLVASAPNAVMTTTSIILDIIKDDTTTPVFSGNIFNGMYLGPSQINIDEIKLSQGFDSNVTFALDGEHAQYFRIEESEGNNVVIVPRTSIPEEVIFKEKVLVFNVLATKPLTVGANAAILITFPADLTDRTILKFSQNTYTAGIDDTNLTADNIVLSSGYEPGTQFILTGDFKDYFTITPDDDAGYVLSLSLSNPLPDVATENTFILLEIEARRERAVSGWTSVVIEIIRQDIVAPVFTQAYYRGAYSAESGLQFDQVISLAYGYDDSVVFSLDGGFGPLFNLSSRAPNSLSIVASGPISNEVLQANNQFLLTVIAAKPGTLAARSVVSIDIEKDLTDRVIMRFAQNTYIAAIQSADLTADSIVLSSGYEPGTQFILTGDFKDYFTITPDDDAGYVLSLSLSDSLPDVATENTFILLEIEARRKNAVSGWTSVVIEIIRQDIVAPVFTQAYYRGAYSAESGLQFDQVISLAYGYDDSVVFSLDGGFSPLFNLSSRGPNSLSIVASEPISNEVLQANNQFLLTVIATKPGTLAARSVVFIDIEKDLTDRVIMRFAQNTYTAAIQSADLTADSIVLSSGYEPGTQFVLTGDFKDYFTITPDNDAGYVLSLSLSDPLPDAATENTFILLEIEARRERAVSGWTSVVIEIIRQDIVAPVFTQAYYRGAYSAESGLQFDQVISLAYGHDDSVVFSLDGGFGPLFNLSSRGPNSLSIVASGPISNEVLQANNQFLLTVIAAKPGTLAARSVVSIDIEKDLTDRVIMRFAQNTYIAAIQNADLTADSIVLSSGYEPGTQFILTGDFKDYFTITPDDDAGYVLSLSLSDSLPDVATENTFILLEIEARRENAVSGWTSVVIEIIRQDIVAPVFTQAYYRGAYSAESGLQFDQVISLAYGYDDSVVFYLDGGFSPLFNLSSRGPNSLSIVASEPISNEVLQANNQFLLTVIAAKPGTLAARSVVSIDIEKDLTDRVIMRFAQNTYTAAIQSADLTADSIVLSSGYEPGTQFILTGDFNDYFTITPDDDAGYVLTLSLSDALPDVATENTFILLEIEARRERAVSGWTSVVIEIIRQDIVAPVFTQAYYRGAYSAESGLQFDQVISLAYGYDNSVVFSLDGGFSLLFNLSSRAPNSLSIVASGPISNEMLQANNQFLLTVIATKPGTLAARSVVSIDIEKDLTDRVIMRFAQNTYTAAIQSADLTADSIVLSSGYEPGTQFILTGDFNDYFTITPDDDAGYVLTLSLSDALPDVATENTFILLEIEARRERAVSGWTSVVIEIIRQDIVAPVFTQAYYRGAYSAESGLQFDQVISLAYGYDDSVGFSLDGGFSSLFNLSTRGPNSLSIVASEPISNEVLQANNQFLLTVIATKPGTLAARSVVSIDIEKDAQTEHGVSFGRYLYQGVIEQDEVRHEKITLTGYNGTSVELLGDYSHLFEGRVLGGDEVEVQAKGTLTLPSGVTTVAFELRAGPAGTALVLRVLQPDESTVPTIPTVTFSPESYVFSVDMSQTGLVGRVSATADNREEITYSLGTDDAHLQTRLSINNEGELYLSAPTNSGVYTFQVIATTVNTRATGTAPVLLSVLATTECDDRGIVMHPLIILDRDEEVSHNNLVVLDPTLHAGCHFTLTNRWPIDQTWLYVNENGLHTIPIDREHASIAFMPLSQVQVEIVLHCEGDSALRVNISERTERLGNYGSNEWILTDTILYNSRRSFVNLIVNDINDNHPIFVGKENEPIAVGYPTNELEERILPRSLAELKATDADIGENAALRYWSSESVLAVAPTTGFVHVRTGAQLQHNQNLIVTATDRNGAGLSGTIQLVVKLLDLNHIAVVTIRNAFLDDETTILARLSDAVGYEVKTLKSVIISDDIDENVTRNKRETDTPKASLQLYVYGIAEREPVAVDRLKEDITTNAAIANVVSTIPLEDHLNDMNILDRQIGLLVATIILSILLFAVMLLVAIWFFLRWRKIKNYNEFNDESNLASRNASLEELPKHEIVKPRLNIQDLKKSEKRLQEMLNSPMEKVTVEPMPKKVEAPVEAILNLPIPEPSTPKVIQSIDKLKDAVESDDEFGEIAVKPRKSVVTFNENVEKIIHVEDTADDDGDMDDDASITASVDASNSGLEIYRF